MLLAATSHFPEHETQRVDVGSLERIEVTHVDGVVKYLQAIKINMEDILVGLGLFNNIQVNK